STRVGPFAKLTTLSRIFLRSRPLVSFGVRVAILFNHSTLLSRASIRITWLLLVGSSLQSFAKQTILSWVNMGPERTTGPLGGRPYYDLRSVRFRHTSFVFAVAPVVIVFVPLGMACGSSGTPAEQQPDGDGGPTVDDSGRIIGPDGIITLPKGDGSLPPVE